MAATKFLLGRGTTFAISTDGTTFTTVKQLKTASFSSSKTDFEDITNFDSLGAVREISPTLIDPGQVTVNGVFDPTDPGQAIFNAAFNAQTLITCKLTFPPMAGMTNSFIRQFTGYVQDHNIDAQFDKALGLAATIKISGPIADTVPIS